MVSQGRLAGHRASVRRRAAATVEGARPLVAQSTTIVPRNPEAHVPRYAGERPL